MKVYALSFSLFLHFGTCLCMQVYQNSNMETSGLESMLNSRVDHFYNLAVHDNGSKQVEARGEMRFKIGKEQFYLFQFCFIYC